MSRAMNRDRVIIVVGAALAFVLAGCEHRAAKAASHPSTAHGATTQSDDGGVAFRDAKHGFSIAYPRGWAKRKGDSAEDVLTVDRDPNKHTDPEITVSVLKLPPHIPGMIPLPS